MAFGVDENDDLKLWHGVNEVTVSPGSGNSPAIERIADQKRSLFYRAHLDQALRSGRGGKKQND